jgi:hypothetical protein
MEDSVQRQAPAALPPWVKEHGTHWIGGWVGPRAGVDKVASGKNIIQVV